MGLYGKDKVNKRLLLLLICLLVFAGSVFSQSDAELKALNKAVEKAGKMVQDKSLKEAMKVCSRNADIARSKRRKDPHAAILPELKNIQIQLRVVAPLAAGQSRMFQDAVASALVQVAGFVRVNGGYAATVQKSGGLQVISLSTPEGSARMNLPAMVKDGEIASGSISADPAVSAGYIVLLEGQELSLARQIKAWPIPPALAQVTLGLKTKESVEVLKAQIPFRNKESNTVEDPDMMDLSVEAQPDEPKVDLQIPYLKYRLPSIGWIGGPVEIQGPFDGDSSNTTVRFDGVQAPVLAETTRSTVVQPPSDQYGVMTLSVQEGGEKVACLFRSLWVTASVPRPKLRPGESTAVTVTVRGLTGLGRPVVVQLDNQTPSSAVLEGGPHQAIVITPGDIRKDGSYELKRLATGLQLAPVLLSATINTSSFVSTCEPPQ